MKAGRDLNQRVRLLALNKILGFRVFVRLRWLETLAVERARED